MSFAGKLQRFVPVEVWPLVGAVAVGCSLSVYAINHHLKYNPDIAIKTTNYSWERFDKDKVEPHLHFLEGAKANQRKHEGYERIKAREAAAAGKQ